MNSKSLSKSNFQVIIFRNEELLNSKDNTNEESIEDD